MREDFGERQHGFGGRHLASAVHHADYFGDDTYDTFYFTYDTVSVMTLSGNGMYFTF